MLDDQELVRQIQQSVGGWLRWRPGSYCKRHTPEKNCLYDKHGRLIKLHLCSLGLVEVPPEVWQCTFLQSLALHNNRLSSLPAEVERLSSLQELYLPNNRLSSLPAEVGQLSSLEVLDLDRNQLGFLPGEVYQLSSLLHLSMYENELSSLPTEVGQLSSLRACLAKYQGFPWRARSNRIIATSMSVSLVCTFRS